MSKLYEISGKLEEIVLVSFEKLDKIQKGRKLNYLEKDFMTRFMNSIEYARVFINFDWVIPQKLNLKMIRDEITKMQKDAKKLNDYGRMKIANEMAKIYNNLRGEYLNDRITNFYK